MEFNRKLPYYFFSKKKHKGIFFQKSYFSRLKYFFWRICFFSPDAFFSDLNISLPPPRIVAHEKIFFLIVFFSLLNLVTFLFILWTTPPKPIKNKGNSFEQKHKLRFIYRSRSCLLLENVISQ